MIVPVNPQEDKTQDIAQENWPKAGDGGEIGPMRHFQLEHYDGDDNRKDPIAECLEPVFYPCAGRLAEHRGP